MGLAVFEVLGVLAISLLAGQSFRSYKYVWRLCRCDQHCNAVIPIDFSRSERRSITSKCMTDIRTLELSGMRMKAAMGVDLAHNPFFVLELMSVVSSKIVPKSNVGVVLAQKIDFVLCKNATLNAHFLQFLMKCPSWPHLK